MQLDGFSLLNSLKKKKHVILVIKITYGHSGEFAKVGKYRRK